MENQKIQIECSEIISFVASTIETRNIQIQHLETTGISVAIGDFFVYYNLEKEEVIISRGERKILEGSRNEVKICGQGVNVPLPYVYVKSGGVEIPLVAVLHKLLHTWILTANLTLAKFGERLKTLEEQTKEKAIKEAENTIAEKRQKLKEEEERVLQKLKELEQKRAEIMKQEEEMQRQIQEREKKIEERELELRKKEEELANLLKSVEEKEKAIQERLKEIEQKEAEIKTKEAEVEERRKQLEEKVNDAREIIECVEKFRFFTNLANYARGELYADDLPSIEALV